MFKIIGAVLITKDFEWNQGCPVEIELK